MAVSEQAPYSSTTDVARELLDIKGNRILDVGCGEGRFTRFLAQAGATVTGLDVRQAVLDRAAARSKKEGVTVEWIQGRAEAMPFEDESFDIVVFSNSLHHVAPELMEGAIREAARVLAPNGTLYVMEPIAAGPYFEATSLVNDEREVRNKALAALHTAGSVGFQPVQEMTYMAKRVFASFEDYAREQREAGEKRARVLDERGEEIRARFLAAARKEDGTLVFDRTFRVNLLRKVL